MAGTAVPAAAAESSVDAAVWAHLAETDDLRAAFVQTQTTAILREPLRSEGTVHFTRPATLEWVVTAPARSAFVLAHGTATLSSPDLGLEERFDLARVPDANRLASSLLVWMTADAAAVERDFVVTYDGLVARLVPRDPALGALVSELAIGLQPAPWRVVSVSIAQPGGDRVDIAFHAIVLDGRPAP